MVFEVFLWPFTICINAQIFKENLFFPLKPFLYSTYDKDPR